MSDEQLVIDPKKPRIRFDWAITLKDLVSLAVFIVGVAFFFGAGSNNQTTQNARANAASEVNAQAIMQLTNTMNALQISVAVLTERVLDLDNRLKTAPVMRYRPPVEPQAQVIGPKPNVNKRPEDLAGWIVKGAHKVKDVFVAKKSTVVESDQ